MSEIFVNSWNTLSLF